MGWWQRLGASIGKRKLCRCCFGEQITHRGVLVCTDCDYAISWPQNVVGICFHTIPGPCSTMRKAH